MALILDGTNGLSDVDGSAATPAVRGTDTNTGIFFPAADTIAFSEGGTEVARFDSAGNLGIGTASPTRKLTVKSSTGIAAERDVDTDRMIVNYNDINSYANSAGAYNTWTFTQSNNSGSVERMRVTSYGGLLINETGTSYSPLIQATGNADNFNISVVKNTGTSYSTGTRLVTFVNSSNAIAGVISHSGATSVTYGTSSDERLKENIVDAPNALDKVMDIKIRSYDWKEDSSHVEYGLVAQELHSVYGEPVGVGGEDITQNAWSIEYGRLTPILLKAIQELKTELDSVKAILDAQAVRIAALESN